MKIRLLVESHLYDEYFCGWRLALYIYEAKWKAKLLMKVLTEVAHIIMVKGVKEINVHNVCPPKIFLTLHTVSHSRRVLAEVTNRCLEENEWAHKLHTS